MATNETSEVYDLLILVDATYSMFSYLESLKTSLPKVIALSKLTNSFARIGLIAYRDYTEADREKDGLIEWSGWYNGNSAEDGADETITADNLMAVAASLEPIGGGDYPEATKSGLAHAYSVMREDATTIVLLYTDAPPHCWMVADKDRGSNYFAEQAALSDENSFGGAGPYFKDWVSASKRLYHGPRKVHVFCFLDEGLGTHVLNCGYYTYLSTVTRGACLYLTDDKPNSIAQVTVDVLLAWMGAEKPGPDKVTIPAKLVRYKGGEGIRKMKDEKDIVANPYFWACDEISGKSSSLRSDAVLKKYLPKKKTPVANFAKRYAQDEQYKTLVVEQLKSIIETDVTSMALNPVFGTLWRAVCNDRENPERHELNAAFGLHVDKIKDMDERLRMKSWLEESYDHTADILDALQSIPEVRRFPCVFLDPTVEFRQAKERGEKEDEGDEEDGEANRSITALRRDELLEIGRSCDGRILRRLGKVITQLTYVETAADLPAHIAATTDAEIPKIPVTLASKEHSWKFWKMLLHAVLPGTMLSTRPAVVLAALAIRIGLKPLFEPASALMMFWREKWNDVEVPETWNSSCLGLLLDADAEYRKQMEAVSGTSVGKVQGLLLNSDRELCSQLVAYKLAEANLLTTLTANVGWTPQKTRIPIGPLVICRGCNYPRSVTMMAEKAGGICGLCVADDWTDTEHKKRATHANVAKEDSDSIWWVECGIRTCRAQYVCYNPGDLNVRPKCWYCRIQKGLPEKKRSDDPAPTLECEKCLSKVIWPREWRAAAPSPFNCVACLNKRETIISVNTNATELCKENGQNWLLRNDNNVLKEPFKRSLFHTITSVGPKSFLENVRVLPTIEPEPALTLRSKCVRNQAELKAELESWIQRRTAEKQSCSLCFSEFANARLLSACHRRGCHQRVCYGCLHSWYGLNSAGYIINMAALSCPFCRRAPSAPTIAAYGKGIHAVGDLRAAVEESGQWIHAWCYDCGKAKRLVERECARGAPSSVERWTCEDSERDRDLFNAQAIMRELERPIKNCPGCNAATQKTIGCDHMKCPVRQCKVDWCWACEKRFDQRTIYQHMDKAHGGWYSGGFWDENDGVVELEFDPNVCGTCYRPGCPG
ncbi:hypothetical protein K458DRAFT_289571 [Lentithecium fluviatile CBS 122367]|uniref:RING-type domain-containing protein n=1 Tax=Lentithecium fluviatile CBS 122367 TaxID=1168545 RepID=A0A6G1JI68_9PLEO|nr:hypothetical protein K458DRAFT_289571 [Lentithecium fluviatile CBS 122367]